VKYEKGKNQIMKSVFSIAEKNENIMSGSSIKKQKAVAGNSFPGCQLMPASRTGGRKPEPKFGY